MIEPNVRQLESHVYERLRPTLVRYVHTLLDVQQYPAWLVWAMQLFGVLLLTVVAVNVAVLVYARTASRRAEITVRTALGAGRRRIVGQLFAEALVLSSLAAALGLAIAQVGYRQVWTMASFEMLMPYWIGSGLSAATVPYAAGLAVLAAFLVGVVPALQATGRSLQSALRRMMGGTGDIEMGRTWTALIVVQVAIAVAVLPAVVAIASNSIWRAVPTETFPVEELLSVRLMPDENTPPPQPPELAAPYVRQQAELLRRLEAERGVAGVTYAGEDEPVRIEPDQGVVAVENAVARGRAVDVACFDVMGVPLLAGRAFEAADLADGASGVIVNRAFVQRFLGPGDPLGRRVRKITGASAAARNETWHEIIGVVADMYVFRNRPEWTEPALYHAFADDSTARSIAVRTRGTTPATLAPRIGRLALEIAPDWQARVDSMSELNGKDTRAIRFVALVVGLMTVSVLLLSAAGISALMSFAVTRRQREIGIRTALGATRGRIVAAIFSRSLRQLGCGLVVGAAVAGALDHATRGELLGGRAAILLSIVAAMMIVAGLLATLGPARRALRIHPMEALRQE